MNQVETLCDRVALINKGRLVVYGTVDEVRRKHSLPEVRVHAPEPLPRIPQVVNSVDEGDGEFRLLLADGSAPSEVLVDLIRAGARIDRFEPLLAPMEDIFLRVVREEAA